MAILLSVQAALLGWSATCHSPTDLEPAFLASGISHWKFATYELYRVNPPLVRMVAALPVLFIDHKEDWTYYSDGSANRPEFVTGTAFIKANGLRSIDLIIFARWACIPFSLAGAYFAYRWSKELYGPVAGLATLVAWVFEPNLLAHGELITPDAACTALTVASGYLFWRWLSQPDWKASAFAGISLGLVQLTKSTSLLLVPLWVVLWAFWRWSERKIRHNERRTRHNGSPYGMHTGDRTTDVPPELSPTPDEANTNPRLPPVSQLIFIGVLSLYILNLGYGFDGTGTRLKQFEFTSMALSGSPEPMPEGRRFSGNRFRGSWLGEIPVPLPKQYVLGADRQKKDLEGFHLESYLRGEWKHGGWWYYYIYGLLVKVPCGIIALFALGLIARCIDPPDLKSLRDECVLLAPASVILIVVSSHTAFNIHLRYVLPTLGLCLVFTGSATVWCSRKGGRFMSLLLVLLFAEFVADSARHMPCHLSYFNHFAGGSQCGPRHLLGSSYDWGQDVLRIASFLNDTYPDSLIVWDCQNSELGELLCTRHNDTRNNTIIHVIDADRYYAPPLRFHVSNIISETLFSSPIVTSQEP